MNKQVNKKQEHKIFFIEKKNFSLWTKEEDDILKNKLKKKKKNKWQLIVSKLNNKSISQIYLRAKLIDPRLKKGTFSKEEDRKLKELVETFGR